MHKGYALAVVGAIAVVAIVALTQSPGSSMSLFSSDLSTHEVAFMNYITEYRKSYFNRDEYEFRYSIFRSNMLAADKHNSDASRTYDQGVNQFSDLTEEEFRQYLGVVVPEAPQRGPVAEFNDVSANTDWVAQGYVNAVKDQGSCGSCWAFSAVGVVESRDAVKNGKSSLKRLSEQELVDCSRSYGNNGCGGGWMGNAFDYDIAEGGENAEADYAYHARDESCKKSGKTKYDKFSGHESVAKSDSALCSALESGPVSVAVYVNGNFQRYRSGIFSDNTCKGQVNHGVIIAGCQDGYLLLRNSWGGSWGEKGYMRMSRTSTNPSGTCQVDEFASYQTGF